MGDPKTVDDLSDLMDEVITELGRAIGHIAHADMSDPKNPKMWAVPVPKDSTRLQELYDSSPFVRKMIDDIIERAPKKMTYERLGLRR